MTLLSFLSADTVHDIGWTLMHFLWQGLVLAAALELILSFAHSANVRHNWALGTLVLMMLAPVVTFLALHAQDSVFDANGAVLTPSAGARVPLDLIVNPVAATWIDWLVLLWLSGVAVLSLRAFGGWVLVEILRRRDTEVLPADLMERCRVLQQQLQVMRPVRFLQSLRISMPVVVGWFQPVILIPVSAIAGLAPQQLDALILHELAHIRRHDAFINALLLAAETLLFYHPAVWWVSRRIRIERENCCDDLAVARCGDAALYVEALASLEAGRLPPGVALAVGGRLKDRAARLLGVPSQTRRYSLGAIMGLVAVSLVAVSVAMAQPGTVAPAETPATQVPDNAVVGNVDFVGNSKITVHDLTHAIHIKAGDVVTRDAVEADVTRLRELYQRNGKYFVRIEPGFIRTGNRTDLIFTITEGPTVGIGRIDFVGNNAFDADTLKAHIATKESAWYRPFSHSDNYDLDRLQFDRESLRVYYINRGYADFKVVSVVSQLTPGGRSFNITYTVSEGVRYRVGNINIDSKIRELPAAQLRPLVDVRTGDVYSQEAVFKAIDALTNAAGTKGSAFAKIHPRLKRNPDTRTIDLGFEIVERSR
jgi:beta-lactamase regulating signal transducer with metallopeptidase domain